MFRRFTKNLLIGDCMFALNTLVHEVSLHAQYFLAGCAISVIVGCVVVLVTTALGVVL